MGYYWCDCVCVQWLLWRCMAFLYCSRGIHSSGLLQACNLRLDSCVLMSFTYCLWLGYLCNCPSKSISGTERSRVSLYFFSFSLTVELLCQSRRCSVLQNSSKAIWFLKGLESDLPRSFCAVYLGILLWSSELKSKNLMMHSSPYLS